MPITKDYSAEASRAEHSRGAKEIQRKLLAEGKTKYAVCIESDNDFESFIETKTFHKWFWAETKEQAGEMALKRALLEGYINPKIQSITVSKELKKKKNVKENTNKK